MFVFKCGHRALKLGLKGILICHDVFQVVDVGETTHIQQLLASKVAELHGIDTVQSLQTLENLAPQRSIYINVGKVSLKSSIHGTIQSTTHPPPTGQLLRIANWLWMNGRLFFHVAGPLVGALHKVLPVVRGVAPCHS